MDEDFLDEASVYLETMLDTSDHGVATRALELLRIEMRKKGVQPKEVAAILKYYKPSPVMKGVDVAGIGEACAMILHGRKYNASPAEAGLLASLYERCGTRGISPTVPQMEWLNAILKKNKLTLDQAIAKATKGQPAPAKLQQDLQAEANEWLLGGQEV